MIRCVIELFGMARQLAQAKEIELELAPGATLMDLLMALGRKAPALIGRVLAPDSRGLTPPYSLNLNGQAFIRDLESQPKDGDHILIMLPAAGG